METTRELFDKVFENMEKNMLNEENGDYVNSEDGLVYCGKCHTAKQQMANVGGVLRKIPKNCDCRSKEIEQERKEMAEFLLKISQKELAKNTPLTDEEYNNIEIIGSTFENISLPVKKIPLESWRLLLWIKFSPLQIISPLKSRELSQQAEALYPLWKTLR